MMRHCFIVGLALGVFPLALGCGDGLPEEDGTGEQVKRPAVVVGESAITIDGRHVGLPGAVSDWEAVLGAPSRRREPTADEAGGFRMLFWDETGIVAYERVKIGKITRVEFLIGPPRAGEASGSVARLPFPGSLRIGDALLDRSSLPGALDKRLGGGRLRPLATFPNHWEMSYGPWTVTVVTNVRGDEVVEVVVSQ